MLEMCKKKAEVDHEKIVHPLNVLSLVKRPVNKIVYCSFSSHPAKTSRNFQQNFPTVKIEIRKGKNTYLTLPKSKNKKKNSLEKFTLIYFYISFKLKKMAHINFEK